jgi:hypothetical protein
MRTVPTSRGRWKGDRPFTERSDAMANKDKPKGEKKKDGKKKKDDKKKKK